MSERAHRFGRGLLIGWVTGILGLVVGTLLLFMAAALGMPPITGATSDR